MKGGKATPGKGGKGAAPTPAPPPESPTHNGPMSPREVARKQRLLHMWKEHKAAIQHEGMTLAQHSVLEAILHGSLIFYMACIHNRPSLRNKSEALYYVLPSSNE